MMVEFDAQTERELDAWRQARLIAYHTAAPHYKEFPKSVEAFLPLPDDHVAESNPARILSRNRELKEQYAPQLAALNHEGPPPQA